MNGKQVNKNIPTNPTGINVNNDVYIYREGHSSDCLLCHIKVKVKQATELVKFEYRIRIVWISKKFLKNEYKLDVVIFLLHTSFNIKIINKSYKNENNELIYKLCYT